MKFKKGIALPFEVIVVSIIALVVLIVIIGLIYGWVPKLWDKIEGFPTLEVEPSAYEQITFIPLVIYRGQDNKMSIGFYNTETADITEMVFPEITCNSISSVTVKSSGLNIPVGDWKRYSALVSVPTDTPTGQYSCIIQISQTDKSFFMGVR